MAKRTITFREWLKLVRKHGFGDGGDHLCGVPVKDVADRLGVARSRVYQLIEEGTLDVVQVTTAAGAIAVSFVTDASLERYLAERTPDRNRQGYFAFAR